GGEPEFVSDDFLRRPRRPRARRDRGISGQGERQVSRRREGGDRRPYRADARGAGAKLRALAALSALGSRLSGSPHSTDPGFVLLDSNAPVWRPIRKKIQIPRYSSFR